MLLDTESFRFDFFFNSTTAFELNKIPPMSLLAWLSRLFPPRSLAITELGPIFYFIVFYLLKTLYEGGCLCGVGRFFVEPD